MKMKKPRPSISKLAAPSYGLQAEKHIVPQTFGWVYRWGAEEVIRQCGEVLSLPSGRAQPRLLVALRGVAKPQTLPEVVWVWQRGAGPEGVVGGHPSRSPAQSPPPPTQNPKAPVTDRARRNPGGQRDRSPLPSVLWLDLPIPGQGGAVRLRGDKPGRAC